MFSLLESAMVQCPRCGDRTLKDVRLFFGMRTQLRYRVGDKVQWRARQPPESDGRPDEGNFQGNGHTVCSVCGLEFPVVVHVVGDILVAVEPSLDRRPYGRQSPGRANDSTESSLFD